MISRNNELVHNCAGRMPVRVACFLDSIYLFKVLLTVSRYFKRLFRKSRSMNFDLKQMEIGSLVIGKNIREYSDIDFTTLIDFTIGLETPLTNKEVPCKKASN